MKAAGLNLFPESDSYKYVSVPDKVSEIKLSTKFKQRKPTIFNHIIY